MEQQKLEVIQTALQLKEAGLSWREVATKINDLGLESDLTGNAIRKRVYRYGGDDAQADDETITFSVDTDGTPDEEMPFVVNRIITQMGFDPSDYEVTLNKLWNTEAAPRFSVSLRERRLPDAERFEQYLEQLRHYAPTYNIPEVDFGIGDKALVVNIFDAHIEKLWVDREGLTAAEAYEKVAIGIVKQARATGLQFEKIIFPIGNDFAHIDNSHSTTHAGTKVESSMSYWDGVDIRTELIARVVEYILLVAPVEIVVVQGNHDKDDAYWLGKWVTARFHNEPNVQVTNDHNPMKFIEYGKNLIMCVHGESGKVTNWHSFMAATAPPAMWANTVHHEIYTGHLHT